MCGLREARVLDLCAIYVCGTYKYGNRQSDPSGSAHKQGKT